MNAPTPAAKAPKSDPAPPADKPARRPRPPKPAADASTSPSPRPAKHSTELVRTSTLNPYHRNPRVGNVPLIVESLKVHGQYKPIIVNRGSKTGRPNEVLAGNHLLRAGLELGLERMLVQWLDVDDDEAASIVLVDNRASDKGGYDNELLAELLQDVPSLDGTGYSEGDLRRLLNGLDAGEAEGLTDPDAVPALPSAKRAKTKPGDVYLLGPHRLVCGDSEHADVIALAVDGRTMDVLWTDPPYFVNYVGKTGDALTIANDKPDDIGRLLGNAFTAALAVLRPGAPVYIAAPPGPLVFDFHRHIAATGYLLRQVLVWVKNTMVLGRSDYQYKHEFVIEGEAPDDPLEAAAASTEALLAAASDDDVSRETSADIEAVDGTEEPASHSEILYGFTPGGTGRLGRGGERWYGDNKQHTVFEVAKPAASRDHPTMKPTDLIVDQLRNSTTRGEAVLDIFAGSGSTIIAAHRLGLIAHLVELDPAYCDVIARRYQEHTGTMPILERTGDGVDFLPKGA